jgi:hypothetical protein
MIFPINTRQEEGMRLGDYIEIIGEETVARVPNDRA